MPESFRQRILPHFTYVLAGGKRDAVKGFDLRLQNGRLTGAFRTETDAPGQLLGFVEPRAGQVTRFDLLAKGIGTRVEDFGFSAGLSVVPKGQKVRVALLFSLADPRDDLARVPPQRAQHNGYLT